MSFGQPDYSVFNPPAYYDSMITDPTQVPTQLYPYGSGGYGPYGPWPGFYFGQRTFTTDDAMRHARERQKFMEHRAEVSDDPSHKYLSAEGVLNPEAAAAIRRAKLSQKYKTKDLVKSIQKRLVITILIGAIISTLLK